MNESLQDAHVVTVASNLPFSGEGSHQRVMNSSQQLSQTKALSAAPSGLQQDLVKSGLEFLPGDRLLHARVVNSEGPELLLMSARVVLDRVGFRP